MGTHILHISDTHLGNLQYRSKERQQDYADAFDEAVRLATDDPSEYKIDAVLHTGDLFHAPNPNVPIVNQCLDTLGRLNRAGIPFLGIVGNHERKRDEQWLDLVQRFEFVDRLDRSPTYVGEGDDRVALYGIDAVRRPEWDGADFELEPPESDEYVLLAMHELLTPPVPEHMAHYEVADVLNRMGIHVDGLALGDYHESERAKVDGTDIWYPGSTEKTARDESADHYVNHLAFTDGKIDITKLRLDSPREFIEFDIEFTDDDGFAHAERIVTKHDLSGKNGKAPVVIAILDGESTGVTANDIHGLLRKHGAAVTKVIDNRGLISAEELDSENVDISEMNDIIDDEVEKLDLSGASGHMEALIRSSDIPKSNLRDEAGSILNEVLDFGDPVDAEADDAPAAEADGGAEVEAASEGDNA